MSTQPNESPTAQNALKHGLTGQFRVLSGESQKDFDQMLAGFLRSENPAGDDEIAMVHQMAESVWLSRRSIRIQNDCFEILASGTEEEKRAAHNSIALYMRYQTTHDRTFVRYGVELRKRRNETRKAAQTLVSQKHGEANENRRQATENRKKEAHDLRQRLQMLRQQRSIIQNRLAAARAERLELQNASLKPLPTLAAAA